MGYSQERNYGCRLSDHYHYKGLKTIVLENEKLRITILVEKGTDIFEFLYKPKDISFMWIFGGVKKTKNYIPSSSLSLGNFMDYYEGAWQEILPNGGDACVYKGCELGQHGEVSNIPWSYQIIEDNEKRVSVKFWVRTIRTPFYLEKIISLEKNKPVLFIEEKLVNEAEEDMELMWGHHPAFGPPFIDENCVILAPAKKVFIQKPKYHPTSCLPEGEEFNWPKVKDKKNKIHNLSKIPPPSVKRAEMAYLKELQDGWYAILNLKMKLGFSLVWDKEVFPYLWYWQEFKGGYGYPWWGKTYNIALEPFSSYPNLGLQEAIKNGSQLKLKPGEEKKLWLRALVFEGIKKIKKVTKQGEIIT